MESLKDIEVIGGSFDYGKLKVVNMRFERDTAKATPLKRNVGYEHAFDDQ
jgi:hypothetical protein